MAVTKKEIDLIIMAHDRASAKFRRIDKSGSSLGRTLIKLGGIAASFVGFRAIARQTVSAINESIGFQKQLAEISTMLDGPATAIMKRYKKEIKDMATEFGQGRDVLTKGLYDILSAGIAAGDGLTVLRVAAKAAIGGVTDTAVAVDALTTVMNAYGLQAEDATKVSDLMFNTVKEGKITYSELAENIGKIAPSAKAANVPLAELFGMLSTMVKVEKPERAFTALRAALMTSAKEGKNFLSVVREMRGADLQNILGAGFAKRAAAGVAILTGNWQELEEQLVKAKNAGGKADIAFQKMADTNSQKIARATQAWKGLKSEIGDVITQSELFASSMERITKTLKDLRKKEAPPAGGRPGIDFGAQMRGLDIGDVGLEIRQRFGAPIRATALAAARRRQAAQRAREAMAAGFRAEPGIEEAPTPLELEDIARARLQRRFRARVARVRRVPSGIRRGEGVEELARGTGLSAGMIAVLKLQLEEMRKQTAELEKMEQNTEVRVEGRRF